MTGTAGPSAVVAGLFALHPLHVESVAWVAERKDVLSALFWMLTMAAYARYVEAPGARRYAVVVAALAAGLLAKPMLVTLPFVLLLLDHWPLGRRSDTGLGKLVLEKLPLVALAAASSVVTLSVQSRGGSVGSFDVFPLDVRLLNAVVSYGAYLAQAVWPVRLAFFYPHPVSAPPIWQVVAATLVLLSVTALAVRERTRRPYLLVGWLWYAGALVPVIGLVQVGAQARADRYTYIPLVGVFVMAAWGLAEAASGRARARNAGGKAGPATLGAPRWVLFLVAAIFLSLAALTNAQTRRWRDSKTLYEHAIEVTGESSIVDNLVGVWLHDEGRYAEAIPWYERAIRLGPGHVRARDNLGLALIRTGQPEKAIPVLLEAIRVSPHAAEPHNTLGIALSRSNRIAEAIPHFREAIALKPDYVQALTNLGTALVAVGSLDEGLRRFDEALRLDPRYAEAHSKLGLTLARQGRSREALAHLTVAVGEEPGNSEARQNLAMAHYLAGDFPRAWEQVQAVRRLGATPQPSLVKLLSDKMPEPRQPAAPAR